MRASLKLKQAPSCIAIAFCGLAFQQNPALASLSPLVFTEAFEEVKTRMCACETWPKTAKALSRLL